MESRTGNGTNLEKLLADMRAVVKDGEELLKTGMTSLKQQARVGAEKTDRAVHEHPYYGMGVGFGLGLVVGLLVSGAFTRKRDTEEDY